MLQATTRELVDHLHSRFPADRNYSKADIDGAPAMPAPIAHYLIRSMNDRSSDHVARIAGDTWIDETQPAVRESLDHLQAALEEAVHVPADQWSRLISDATEAVVVYLVDPVDRLTEFVFHERSPLPTTRVRQRMAYFSPYSYLHSVFTAYAERKSVKSIESERFNEVLTRIDHQMVADYTADKWEGLFRPLYEVLGVLARPSEEPRVPADLIRRLAAEKKFDALVKRLNRANGSRLTFADTQSMIAAALEQPRSSPQEAPAQREQPATRRPSEPQPRWKQFQQGQTRPSSVPSTPQPKPSSRPRRSSSDSSGQPLWQQFQRSGTSGGNSPGKESRPSPEPSPSPQPTRSPSPAPSPSPSSSPEPEPRKTPRQASSDRLGSLEERVIGVIPGDQRDRFVRTLFSGSQDDYEDVLGRLDDVNSWEQASSLIAKKVFLPHQVNIYSEPAVTFTDLVETRLRQASVR